MTHSAHARTTRGHGLLEEFLSKKRAAMAEKLIGEEGRTGAILDIGSGSFPFFLRSTKFSVKCGLDKLATNEQIGQMKQEGISLVRHDIATGSVLPFQENRFQVVTMLAVFEHIEKQALLELTAEIHRILVPGGRYILTTPAGWADFILRAMQALHLVSGEEVEEHQDKYTHAMVKEILVKGGFRPEHITQGGFELGMNMWAVARKP